LHDLFSGEFGLQKSAGTLLESTENMPWTWGIAGGWGNENLQATAMFVASSENRSGCRESGSKVEHASAQRGTPTDSVTGE
jgi:hypothetical protein